MQSSIKIIILFMFITMLMSGCSATQHVGPYGNHLSNPDVRMVCIVSDDAWNGKGTDQVYHYINEAFHEHGFQTHITSEKPKDFCDIYLKYNEVWRNDIFNYLAKLDIDLYDDKTNYYIVSGTYDNRNNLLHKWPNAKETTYELVNSIIIELRKKIKTELSGGPQN